jgi:hypothetical protein
MSLMLDIKYATMMSSSLRNYSKKNNTINFSCNICGDSKKIITRARGYLYPTKGNDALLYKCWNCSAALPFGKLLQMTDNNLYSEYQKDKFLEVKETKPKVEKHFAPPKFKAGIDPELVKISALPIDHFAIEYVKNRLIPSKWHYKLFFIKDFKRWTNKLVPGTFDRIFKDEPRLIIPLIDRNHNVVGYQGRSFDPEHPVKYITTLTNPDAEKMFGMDEVVLNKTIRVLEGPLDAMFVDNAIATTGGDQHTILQRVGVSKDRAILVYDNEPRNKYTIEKMRKGLEAGWTVCVWPSSVEQSDVNDMVKAGMPLSKITSIIDDNAKSGLMGLAALAEWRKV